jgi:GNAT superfamily N-acetyltransferase
LPIGLEGAEALDELEPLWLALREHHGAAAPELGPLRALEESWAQRRAQYADWLTGPDAFVLIARRDDGRAVGYALVVLRPAGGPTWTGRGLRLADVETLSVMPEARGAGLGRQLLDAVAEHARTLGVEEVELTVIAQNADARRFYAREGFRETRVVLRRGLA